MAIYSWFSRKKMVIFHSYVSLPEGTHYFGGGSMMHVQVIIKCALFEHI